MYLVINNFLFRILNLRIYWFPVNYVCMSFFFPKMKIYLILGNKDLPVFCKKKKKGLYVFSRIKFITFVIIRLSGL